MQNGLAGKFPCQTILNMKKYGNPLEQGVRPVRYERC